MASDGVELGKIWIFHRENDTRATHLTRIEILVKENNS